jgi:acetyl esterase/lipase
MNKPLFPSLFVIAMALCSIAAWAQAPGGPPAVPAGTNVYPNISYVRGGGSSQQLDIYVPAGVTHEPLIVMIHGGMWMFGDKSGENAAKFLNAGFAVASVNYRLIHDAKWPAQIEDCKAAVRWLRANAKQYGYDPGRIGAAGESAGGHLVAMLGTAGEVKTFDVGENLSVSSKVQAVADFYGPTDIVNLAGERAPGGPFHGGPESPESLLIGGDVQLNKARARTANPITYITPLTPPFFIAHGDADNMVPDQQSIALDAALRKAGVASTLYLLKGVGHGFDDPTANRMAVEFFEKVLNKS